MQKFEQAISIPDELQENKAISSKDLKPKNTIPQK